LVWPLKAKRGGNGPFSFPAHLCPPAYPCRTHPRLFAHRKLRLKMRTCPWRQVRPSGYHFRDSLRANNPAVREGIPDGFRLRCIHRMEETMTEHVATNETILVVGGGISGMTAAL